MSRGELKQKAKSKKQKAWRFCRGWRSIFAFCFLLFAFLLVSCRQKMAVQPRYDPLEPSDFFSDHMAARPRIPGTIARGEAATTGPAATGKINGVDVDGYPFAITPAVMNRGEERYNIYCAPCHGRLGDGNGMIPSRGYRRPPSYHTDALRKAPTGHYFDVMTNGFGSMPSYAPQVSVPDRWAIIAYIRALQLAHNGTVNDLTAEERGKLR